MVLLGALSAQVRGYISGSSGTDVGAGEEPVIVNIA